MTYETGSLVNKDIPGSTKVASKKTRLDYNALDYSDINGKK
jgi:hypothetical protein